MLPASSPNPQFTDRTFKAQRVGDKTATLIIIIITNCYYNFKRHTFNRTAKKVTIEQLAKKSKIVCLPTNFESATTHVQAYILTLLRALPLHLSSKAQFKNTQPQHLVNPPQTRASHHFRRRSILYLHHHRNLFSFRDEGYLKTLLVPLRLSRCSMDGCLPHASQTPPPSLIPASSGNDLER